MVIYLFLGIALLFGFWLIGLWYVRAQPSQVAGTVKLIAFVLIVAAIGLLVAFGRLSWALIMLPALLPWLLRARAMKNMWKAARGPTGGQTSNVSTESLAMELDHDSGEMDGTVLAGPFEGRRLSDLDQVLLIDLYRWMAAQDEQGARGAASGSAGMTRKEAYEVLGLEPGASADAIRKAYRRLMQHAHPDKGGSPYLAAKINAAKDLLLSDS